MSQKALLMALRDYVKQKLGLGQEECEVMEDGRPPADCGQKFLAIHPGGFTGDHDLSLRTTHAVTITLSMRAPAIPHDRRGPALLIADGGLYDTAERIIAAVHMDPGAVPATQVEYDIVNAANDIIETNVPASGYFHPLEFQSASVPMQKPGKWFDSDPKEETAGLAIELQFGNAGRVQKIEDQT